MTIERAEFITKTVADLFAKKGKNLLPRSALHDWSFKMISQAFALTIAKYRQISDGSSEQEYFCKKYAENAAGLVALLKMTIIPNDEFSTMFRLPIDSPDLPLLRLRAIQRRLASETQEDIELSQQEALSAFNEFCWSLNPCSELYWQNVYTRVGLKYDENCPTGMPFLKKDTTEK